MKSVLLVGAGLLIGAVGVWSVQFFQGQRDGPRADEGRELSSSGDNSTALNTPPGSRPGPRLIGGPLFGDDGLREDESTEGDAPRDPVPEVGTPTEPEIVRQSPIAVPVTNPIASRWDRQDTGAGGVEAERRLARTTYDSGEKDLGRRLLVGVYNANRDNIRIDLSPEVERLLAGESSFARRREYLLYLASHSPPARLYSEQLERAQSTHAEVSADSSATIEAWNELSLAYELASDVTQRSEVLARLEPLLDDYVFSGRASPLLTTYIVKPGDNLSSIAVRFRTTVAAIRRLNSLKSDVIKVKKRLRLLSGKLRIYVDKSEFRLWATVDHRVLLERSVGLGLKNSTPIGDFAVTVREVDPVWWRPGEPPIPANDERNILGSRWLGFKETVEFSGYGIHGTTDPASIGRQASAGCVRMLNEDVELLYDFVAYNSPVSIRE